MHKGQEGNGEDDKEAGDDDDEEEEEGGELMVTAADACLERGSRTGLSVLGGNDVNGQYTDILRNTKLCFILLPEQ